MACPKIYSSGCSEVGCTCDHLDCQNCTASRTSCMFCRGRGRQVQQGSGEAVSQWGVALCLWCLNPAVVFKSLSEAARCVLLTSGTLSPLDSFSGELGLRFHLQLEARHVVDMSRQVWCNMCCNSSNGCSQVGVGKRCAGCCWLKLISNIEVWYR